MICFPCREVVIDSSDTIVSRVLSPEASASLSDDLAFPKIFYIMD